MPVEDLDGIIADLVEQDIFTVDMDQIAPQRPGSLQDLEIKSLAKSD